MRRLLLAGAALLVLPAFLFEAVLVVQFSRREWAQSRSDLVETAARFAEVLDRELSGLLLAARVLAANAGGSAGVDAAFASEARAVSLVAGRPIELIPAGSRLASFGTAGPASPLSDGAAAEVERVLSRGEPLVSDLFAGPSGRAQVAVLAPVVRDGRAVAAVAVWVDAAGLSASLRQQMTDETTVVNVRDSRMRLLARTRGLSQFIGRTPPTGPPTGRPDAAGEPVEAVSLDGERMLVVSVSLRVAPWTLAAGVPLSTIRSPIRRSVLLLASSGLLAAALGGVLAWRLARELSRPLVGLAAAGRDLGAGRPVLPLRTRIAEIGDVSAALVAAGAERREREAALAGERARLAGWADRLEGEVEARIAQLEQANGQLRDEITARARAEERARQSQKMEAVGRLTGGIAHDFNNLLTIIMGSLDLLRRAPGDARSRRLIESATEGTTRAAELVARLLAFSRRQPLLPQVLDVNRLVLGMSSLFRRTLGEAVDVQVALDEALWPAMADPNQLESALLNLAVNARDAIGEAGRAGGVLRIATSNATVADGPGCSLQPGEYVAIATSDNGAGMAADTLAQVFEPFFTTKGLGHGTGLGLSQVHGFAVQSGGQVSIRSAPGQGTEVRLLLPRAAAGDGAAAPAATEGAAAAAGTGRLVLVVEDDAAVRQFTAEALRLLGYGVLEAEGGPSALAVLEARDDVDLLLTDVAMPGMSGRELARRARLLHRGLPILLVSGYSGPGVEEAGWALLPKPFSVAALARKVAEALP